MSFEYIIKFVIGASPRSPEVLAPGYYWTAINIFNASACTDATMTWKAARALPGLVAGPSSPWSHATLARGRGFEIDNADIDRALILGGDERKPIDHPLGRIRHGKGFVVIRSELALDIVAVYTASEGREQAPAIHTERVVGRVVERKACGTLEVNCDTNSSWILVSSPNDTISSTAMPSVHLAVDDRDGARRRLGTFSSSAAWAAPVGGAQWIGSGPHAAQGTFVYERSFVIDCDDVYAITGSLTARSDNASRYLLNGVEFASIGMNFSPSVPAATLPLPPASLLRLGVNTLRVEVYNDGGPVGLMIDGELAIARATCGRFKSEPVPVDPKDPTTMDPTTMEGVELVEVKR